MSGITKTDKLLLWLVIIWSLMTGGPGLYLCDRPEFVGGLPILYIYCLVGWVVGIALHIWIVKSASFVNLGKIETDIIEQERRATEAAVAAMKAKEGAQ